jgi:hypothetical protein
LATSDQFNASGSLAGYLYQCRLALLLGLQVLKKKPNSRISIEKFDDIAFGDENLASCIIQAKHHVTPKSLSSNSVDVWKTLRIWVQDFTSSIITTRDTCRLLITTAVAEDGSAMAKLRHGTGRDVAGAREALQRAAKTSKNVTTEPGRKAFLALTDNEAELLLASIEVIDGSSSLPDVLDEIEGELTLLAPNHTDKIAEALEGWWLKVVAKCLVGEGSANISLQDIVKKANEIGNSYGPDKLPLSDPHELGDKPYDPNDEAETYVRQMRLVGLSEPLIRRGIRDYYRANAQRSKWARENLLLDGEVARYDAKLRDRWERRFDADCADLAAAGHDEKRKVGRQIFNWAHQEQIDFRNIVETWITAGSFQGLADRLEVGWHPEYLDQLGDKGGSSGEA